ncbi:1-acyl-sn-glycerol-3-phosphate acyltransferase [Psychrobacter phenylpyruvicus]|nr:1-acyl-sn-glycerol-3-phosphate acyltransferase [Psychrobacter phenylpyruvicus]SUD98879.1 2-acyl-glycerophospho-ethanolamine acyltransferase [Psychrobacter phenylpyruvicus]
MGKDSLFKYPVLARFFKWAGIIPINRSKKGSVLQATIDRLKSSESLYLGLAPEGTRNYTDKWKTGFYYIAEGAQVPIIPVAMDYKTKEIRF